MLGLDKPCKAKKNLEMIYEQYDLILESGPLYVESDKCTNITAYSPLCTLYLAIIRN